MYGTNFEFLMDADVGDRHHTSNKSFGRAYHGSQAKSAVERRRKRKRFGACMYILLRLDYRGEDNTAEHTLALQTRICMNV